MKFMQNAIRGEANLFPSNWRISENQLVNDKKIQIHLSLAPNYRCEGYPSFAQLQLKRSNAPNFINHLQLTHFLNLIFENVPLTWMPALMFLTVFGWINSISETLILKETLFICIGSSCCKSLTYLVKI